MAELGIEIQTSVILKVHAVLRVALNSGRTLESSDIVSVLRQNPHQLTSLGSVQTMGAAQCSACSLSPFFLADKQMCMLRQEQKSPSDRWDSSPAPLVGKDVPVWKSVVQESTCLLCLHGAGREVGEPDPEPEARRMAQVQVLFGL